MAVTRTRQVIVTEPTASCPDTTEDKTRRPPCTLSASKVYKRPIALSTEIGRISTVGQDRADG